MKRVSELNTARKYAKALFAVNPDNLKKLQAVNKVVSENLEFFTNPLVSQATIEEVVKKLKLDDDLNNVLIILWTNKNVDLFGHVVLVYEQLYKAANGIVDCSVISHEALDKANLKAISDKLVKLTNKKVNIENIVDPAILGGLILKFGDTVVDNSYLTKLNEIKSNLLEA